MALWRISQTAPSKEQISKIYHDELSLFRAGAQCALFGTQDAVKAMAHDDSTGELHVSTPDGRSTFNGLERVSNTTISVNEISASNGLIVEG